LNDLDTAMSSYKEDDEVQVKNYLAFRNWKIKWQKITNPIISLTPPRSKRDIELMPHIIVDKKWIEILLESKVELDEEDK
jgi:hypothetical protein